AVREELGDVLLQVLFHARIAAERPDGYDIDDVARTLVEKLVGRHPHVFGDGPHVATSEEQHRRWDQLKRAEKERESSADGVPLGHPAVARAARLVGRAQRAGLPADVLPPGPAAADYGDALFALAAAARVDGVDPEAALRAAAKRFADQVRAAERSAAAAGV